MHPIVRLGALSLSLVLAALPAHAQSHSSSGGFAYDLPTAGVLIEGVGYDPQRETIYVSGVNDGGRIYRGRVGVEALEVWLPGGVDGRTTARGIDVDGMGQVFIAGGPSGPGCGWCRPTARLWLHSQRPPAPS